MASKSLSGLTETMENRSQHPNESRNQGPENSITAGNSPAKEGLQIRYDGPKTHTELLEFYFGHPSSTVKSTGLPKRSSW